MRGYQNMTKRPADQLYSQPLQDIVDFKFDESVTHVFADMINRSVPGYANLISMIGIIGAEYAQPDSNIYDLGCSLGACSLSLQHHVKEQCTIIAVDNSEPMIKQLVTRVDPAIQPTISAVCTDLQDMKVEQASVVVLNYTLQFIPLAQRHHILKHIYDGMQPGAVLILSEKLTNADENQQQSIETLHHSFKKSQGYSSLEIAQKRAALENSLIPETFASHHQRLTTIGFTQVQQWFQCFNFASLMAVK